MNIRWKRKALSDLESIHDYIASHDLMAAKRVVRRVVVAIERLRNFPQSGRPGSVPNARFLVVPGLLYIVVYRVGVDAVDIVAIVHSARRERK